MVKTKKFQRKKENFVCENCGERVLGNGYTDHCLKCLFSRHVDINPGDRQEKCGGMMKPVGIETKSGRYVISYKCSKCRKNHKVKAAKNDNFEALLKL